MTRFAFGVALAAVGLLLAPAVAQPPAPPDRTVDPAERAAVIDGVLEKVEANYVFPEVGKKMAEAVRARKEKGEYDAITSGKELAAALTTHLREVCKDKHLRVGLAGGPPTKGTGQGPSADEMKKMREIAALRNFGFRKAERLGGGGVGLLDLEGFGPPEAIGETAAAAMSFLANSEAVIVDLRRNGGGSPGGVVLLCSYFFDEPTHLNSIYERSADTTQQYWSHPSLPGKKLVGKDVYVLTSSRTFSGAEEFAYNLQTQKKATVVGETTGGGAHPTRGFRVGDHFLVGVPFARSINPVTKTNWEGTGVKPDVAVPADRALHTAHLMALEKSAKRHADDPELSAAIRHEIETVKRELAALKGGGDPAKE